MTQLFAEIRSSLSPEMRQTAYALACDVIAVDSRLNRDELRALEFIREQLEVPPEVARSVEDVTRIRFVAA